MSMTQTTPRTSKLSLASLAEMEANIAKSEQKLAADKADLRAKVASLAQSYTAQTAKAFPTIKASNTNGVHKAKPKSGKVAVKYRSGENTWTGRGRAPRWLVAAEKQGAKRDSFRVSV